MAGLHHLRVETQFWFEKNIQLFILQLQLHEVALTCSNCT